MKQIWNRKKSGRRLAAMMSVLLCAVLSMAMTCTALADETGSDKFVQGTAVNGLGIGGLTVDEAAARISSFYANEYKLTIKERGGKEETITGPEIGFTVGLPEGFLQNILNEENTAGRISGPDAATKFRAEMANTFSAEALDAKIQALNCISGSSIVTTADAHVSGYQEGQEFAIIPEVRGNNVYVDKTIETLRNAVTTGATEVNLEDAGCYYNVAVTSDDAGLKDLLNTMNQCRTMTITYTIGENQETLDPATICSWLTGTQDGQIQVNRDMAAAYVQGLADKYNTAGTTRSFHSASGRDVSVSGSYGWKIDVNGEADALIGMIRTGQSQSREPQYSSAAASHTAPEWGNTYVEVDLTNQHVYMTQNGAVVWDAPCVTGNASKHYDTPAGIYTLTYKERDRVLRGEKKADGTYEYESPVSYWMPFNGGIGLHDANWRSSFGGSIYKTGGSHGCVNLPPAKAAALYNLVYKGIPVICYH